MKKLYFDLLPNEIITKEEPVRYIKLQIASILSLLNHLYLTNKRIILTRSTSWLRWLCSARLYLLFLEKSKKTREKDIIFSLNFDKIKGFRQGKHGLNRNILIIESIEGKEFKLALSDKYENWKNKLKEFKLKEL